jgi:glucose 1-dehydrogenase
MPAFQQIQPLQGQRALVIHADTGIGATVAEALADAGAKVMINYLGEREKANLVAERIRAKQGQAMLFQADVSQESQVKSMFDVFIAYWDSIDILVTNASLQMDAVLADMRMEHRHKVISSNLTGQFQCARKAAREFLRRGVKPELSGSIGKIICLSSIADTNDKGSSNLLMKTLAQEFSGENIRVNGISQAIKKPLNSKSKPIPEEASALLNLVSDECVCDPEDIAKIAVWLASDEAGSINGETFYARGGLAVSPGLQTNLKVLFQDNADFDLDHVTADDQNSHGEYEK